MKIAVSGLYEGFWNERIIAVSMMEALKMLKKTWKT